MSQISRQPEPALRLMDNPLLLAHARLRLRRRESLATFAIVAMLGGTAVLFGLSSHLEQTGWLIIGSCLLSAISILLFFVGTSRLLTAVALERESGLLEFHRATPTSPLTDTVGLLLGCPAREYLASALLVPLYFFAGMLGGFPVLSLIIALGSILSCTLLYHTVALLLALSGLKQSRKTTGGVMVGLYILLSSGGLFNKLGLTTLAHLTPFPILMDLARSLQFMKDNPELGVEPGVRFFGLWLPTLSYSMLVQGSLLTFFFLAAVRRMKDPQLPLFSRLQALSFQAVMSLIMLGGAWGLATGVVPIPSTSSDSPAPGLGLALVGAGYAGGAVILACVLVFLESPTYGVTLRTLRRANRLGRLPSALEDGASTTSLTLGLGLITTLGLMLLAGSAGSSLDPASLFGPGFFLSVGTAFVLPLFVSSALEWTRHRTQLAWKSSATVIFFVAFVGPALLTMVITPASNDGAVLYLLSLSPLASLATSVMRLAIDWGRPEPDAQELVIHALISLVTSLAATAWFLLKTRSRTLELLATMKKEGQES